MASTVTVESVASDIVEQGKELVAEAEKAVRQVVEAGTAALEEMTTEFQTWLKDLDVSEFLSTASDRAGQLIDLQQEYVSRTLDIVLGKDAA